MRYPIYFFLLLSGFFYLTGKPVDEKPSQVAVNGQSQLPYARKIANPPVPQEVSVKPLKFAKTVVEPLGPVADEVGPQQAAIAKATSAALADKKDSSTAKAVTATAKADGTKGTIKQASLQSANDATDAGWKTSVKLSKKDTALGAAVGTYLANNRSFDTRPVNSFKRVDRKKLDWTVFGNSRKTVTAALPKRVRTRDELDAEGLTSDNIKTRRQVRKRKAASRKAKKSKRRVKRRASKSRKLRRVKKRKLRRYARLHKRHRNVRRIAKRRTVRKSRKRRYASRRHRKKFGFSTNAGITSLFGGN